MTTEEIIQMRIDLTVAGHDNDTSPQTAAMIKTLAEQLRWDENK